MKKRFLHNCTYSNHCGLGRQMHLFYFRHLPFHKFLRQIRKDFIGCKMMPTWPDSLTLEKSLPAHAIGKCAVLMTQCTFGCHLSHFHYYFLKMKCFVIGRETPKNAYDKQSTVPHFQDFQSQPLILDIKCHEGVRTISKFFNDFRSVRIMIRF